MFSKNSRYRKLPDFVTIDRQGREITIKNLRPLPEVTGTFLHTIEDGDRLDHLAFRYYKQPRKWWRICDANPQFMSPQTLLGTESIVTFQFPLSFSGNGEPPPLSLVIRNLAQQPGIEKIRIREEIQLVEEKQSHNHQDVIINTEKFKRFILVTFNQMNTSSEAINDIIKTAGFKIGKPEIIGRVGKEIVIPSDVLT
jgi:hypothetical protein